MKTLSLPARLYIGIVGAMGMACLAEGFLQHTQSMDSQRFLGFLAVALLCSTFKVSLPGIPGSMSVNFLFILIGALNFTVAETLTIGCLATAVQCLWKPRKQPKAVQVLFSIASMAVSVSAAHHFYHWMVQVSGPGHPLVLLEITA